MQLQDNYLFVPPPQTWVNNMLTTAPGPPIYQEQKQAILSEAGRKGGKLYIYMCTLHIWWPPLAESFLIPLLLLALQSKGGLLPKITLQWFLPSNIQNRSTLHCQSMRRSQWYAVEWLKESPNCFPITILTFFLPLSTSTPLTSLSSTQNHDQDNTFLTKLYF